MSVSRKSEKWLLVQWSSGDRAVVSSLSLEPGAEAKVGAVVTLARAHEEEPTATIIGSARDRQLLEQQISPRPYSQVEVAGPSNAEEPQDFSGSSSSWEPSDEDPSTDDEEEVKKQNKVKLEQYSRFYSNRRTSKVLKPVYRVNAIDVSTNNRKRKHEKSNNNNPPEKKSLPDFIRVNHSPAPDVLLDKIEIDVSYLMEMTQPFKELFMTMNELKPPSSQETNSGFTSRVCTPAMKKQSESLEESVNHDDKDHSGTNNQSQSDEFERSDDNVLITNKFDKVDVQTPKVTNTHAKTRKVLKTQDKNVTVRQADKKQNAEWIPIGSGKTLIHKDQFRKVNWKSYTIATRTLLLAVFTRRVLATHSLTGKRSPAFQNKPAKMCLDPKAVTDVIIEITDRFDVKENLVRSIITTKCADECKMYKTRMNRKNSKEQENVSPTFEDDDDAVN